MSSSIAGRVTLRARNQASDMARDSRQPAINQVMPTVLPTLIPILTLDCPSQMYCRAKSAGTDRRAALDMRGRCEGGHVAHTKVRGLAGLDLTRGSPSILLPILACQVASTRLGLAYGRGLHKHCVRGKDANVQARGNCNRPRTFFAKRIRAICRQAGLHRGVLA